MSFTTFEDIEAWQGARQLAQKLKVCCDRATLKHDYAWIDQINRAAVSIMANIAEGNDAQTNAEFILFLGYAKRSGAEVRSHLYVGLDRGYVLQQEFDELSLLARRITAQLAQLIRYLQKHRDGKKRGSGSGNPVTSQPETSYDPHTKN